ncbi:hypothetical protein Hdeb2414_s0127g00805561 [Helianthus debilis subsp. tardiflorus]
MEIDLTAEKVKAETAEEAHKVSLAALNVAQENYAEVQSTMGPLISDLEWMQHHEVVYIANSILNATELDRAVDALTMAAGAVGHRVGYVECANHVEEALSNILVRATALLVKRLKNGWSKLKKTMTTLHCPLWT